MYVGYSVTYGFALVSSVMCGGSVGSLGTVLITLAARGLLRSALPGSPTVVSMCAGPCFLLVLWWGCLRACSCECGDCSVSYVMDVCGIVDVIR